jgi:hypothetical protein
MADEGGVSAALLEIENPKERLALHPGVRRRRAPIPWLIAGVFGVLAIAGAWPRIRAIAS